MTKPLHTICVWAGTALLGLSVPSWAADAPAAHASMPDISGTYELVKRVLPDRTEVLPPAIGGLYTLSHGRRNFNVFWTEKDGKPVSLSIVATYTLTGGKYCEKATFWLQNNLGKPGIGNQPPPAAKDCAAVTVTDGKVSFQPAGEPVLSFDKDSLVATNAGQFVDTWKRLR
jgi:hypothetical protein